MEPKEENMHVVPVTLLDTELPATKCSKLYYILRVTVITD